MGLARSLAHAAAAFAAAGLAVAVAADLLLLVGLHFHLHSSPWLVRNVLQFRHSLWINNVTELPALFILPLQAVLAFSLAAAVCICCSHRLWLPFSSKDQHPPQVLVQLLTCSFYLQIVLDVCGLCFTAVIRLSPQIVLHHVVALSMLSEVHELTFLTPVLFWFVHELFPFLPSIFGHAPSLGFWEFASFNIPGVFGAVHLYYLGVMRRGITRRVGLHAMTLTTINYSVYCTFYKGSMCLVPIDQDLDAFVMLADGKSKQQVAIESGCSAAAAAVLALACVCLLVECWGQMMGKFSAQSRPRTTTAVVHAGWHGLLHPEFDAPAAHAKLKPQ